MNQLPSIGNFVMNENIRFDNSQRNSIKLQNIFQKVQMNSDEQNSSDCQSSILKPPSFCQAFQSQGISSNVHQNSVSSDFGIHDENYSFAQIQ
jgi:hypothetical protein